MSIKVLECWVSPCDLEVYLARAVSVAGTAPV
jgi:hypothetical protein